MWKDETDDDRIIKHSCALIANAAAIAGKRRICSGRCVHKDENNVLYLKFTLGLGQIIFDAPIKCSILHFGNFMTSWRKELN